MMRAHPRTARCETCILPATVLHFDPVRLAAQAEWFMSSKRRTPGRILNAVSWRLLRRQKITVYRRRAGNAVPPDLDAIKLLHYQNPPAPIRDRVRRLMRECGETGDVEARFAAGDQFFALEEDGQIVTFRWVTFQSSECSHKQLVARQDRAFVYNGFTPVPYRGRGLAGMLDAHLDKVLADQGRVDLVCGIFTHNKSSLIAIRKCDYEAVAEVPELVLLNRVRVPLPARFFDPAARKLFRPSGGA